MNFLQLVQKLHQKTGGAGAAPTTVIDQVGESADYVSWVQEAWTLIQAEEQYWKWMRKEANFQTQAGKSFYLPSATAGETGYDDVAMWLENDSWRCYKTATGRSDESYLVWWDYQIWRDTFDFATQAAITQKPTVIARRDADNALLFGNTPDDVYTVTGQYQSTPADLELDADVPGLPARFHLIIVYRAMMLYGKFEAAPEVIEDGREEYDKLMSALRTDQLDEIGFGAPLA